MCAVATGNHQDAEICAVHHKFNYFLSTRLLSIGSSAPRVVNHQLVTTDSTH